MSLQTTFDEEVQRFNDWLLSSTKQQSAWKDFLNAIGLLLNIAGNNNTEHAQGYGSQLYSRQDITPQQRDAITIGSDYQRIIKRLDTILVSGQPSNEGLTVKEATIDKQVAQQMYEHYRNVYETSQACAR